MTFSVAERDPRTGDIGVAVASKFLAVDALVPFVKSGVGAVATQSYVNPNFGPDGLALLAGGQAPQDVAAHFAGTGHGHRAAAIWAGEPSGAQRDLDRRGLPRLGGELGRARTWRFRATCWQGQRWSTPRARPGKPGTRSPSPTACRLPCGPESDRRGRQSAALVCAGPGRGYAGLTDDWVNLRADDHADPCAELERLLKRHDSAVWAPGDERAAGGGGAGLAARPADHRGGRDLAARWSLGRRHRGRRLGAVRRGKPGRTLGARRAVRPGGAGLSARKVRRASGRDLTTRLQNRAAHGPRQVH
ncbi:DUF1028 domain-containing protein [Deinococcus taklimakanensis]